MKNTKYKVIVIALLLFCGITSYVYSNFTFKIEELLSSEETVKVSNKPISKFNVHDVLSSIYDYNSLEIIKISLEAEKLCTLEVSYKGEVHTFIEILEKLKVNEGVKEISSMSFDNTKNEVIFHITFNITS
jgi:hypothetical protein